MPQALYCKIRIFTATCRIMPHSGKAGADGLACDRRADKRFACKLSDLLPQLVSIRDMPNTAQALSLHQLCTLTTTACSSLST